MFWNAVVRAAKDDFQPLLRLSQLTCEQIFEGAGSIRACINVLVEQLADAETSAEKRIKLLLLIMGIVETWGAEACEVVATHPDLVRTVLQMARDEEQQQNAMSAIQALADAHAGFCNAVAGDVPIRAVLFRAVADPESAYRANAVDIVGILSEGPSEACAQFGAAASSNAELLCHLVDMVNDGHLSWYCRSAAAYTVQILAERNAEFLEAVVARDALFSGLARMVTSRDSLAVMNSGWCIASLADLHPGFSNRMMTDFPGLLKLLMAQDPTMSPEDKAVMYNLVARLTQHDGDLQSCLKDHMPPPSAEMMENLRNRLGRKRVSCLNGLRAICSLLTRANGPDVEAFACNTAVRERVMLLHAAASTAPADKQMRMWTERALAAMDVWQVEDDCMIKPAANTGGGAD